MAVLSSRWAEPAAKRWFSGMRELARRVKAPAALRNLASMPLFVAGVGCIDWGVFTCSTTAGLIVTGLSLIGIEFLIAED